MSLKNLDLSVLKTQDILLLHEPLNKPKVNQKKLQESEYIYIGNIPKTYKSADLRFFFQKPIESGTFKCFHYRHRPEKQVVVEENLNSSKCKDDAKNSDENTTLHETCCCIASIYSSFVDRLIETYHGNEWRDRKLNFLTRTVNIRKLRPKPKPPPNKSTTTYTCRGEEKPENNACDQLYQEDLDVSIELNPPSVILPQGNVGTPTKHFHKLIQECKMPPSLIKSLDIQFPKCVKLKKYGNVPPIYDDDVEPTKKTRLFKTLEGMGSTTESTVPVSHRKKEIIDFLVHTSTSCQDKETDSAPVRKQNTASADSTHTNATHHDGADEDTLADLKPEGLPHKSCDSPNKNESEVFKERTTNRMICNSDIEAERSEEEDEKLEEEEEEEEEEDGAEDWERHETLHDDVPNQSRLKERLYEEDMEVVWEKGGSGLVFYTDAYAWNEMKGKDFDADTADDWDVDYSVYYHDGAGDKPARDQLQMRLEAQRRRGEDGPSKPSQLRSMEKRNRHQMNNNFAEFEKYSNAFGSRILKKQGWKQGSGVGSSREGIREPISSSGHKPYERTGLGYYGEKLERNVAKGKRKVGNVEIGTVYDDVNDNSGNNDLLRFQGLDQMKYRDKKKSVNE